MSSGTFKMLPTNYSFTNHCDTMLGIRCVGVCGYQSDNSFVYLCAKPTQRACTRDLPRDRKDEGRNAPEKKDSIERSSRDQSTEQAGREMRIGQRGDQSTKVRKAAARTH